MGSILNDDDRKAICQRIGSITSASVPRWGQMDVSAMLNHLRLSALMALGELSVANKGKRAFQVFPIKHEYTRSCTKKRDQELLCEAALQVREREHAFQGNFYFRIGG